MSSTHPSDVPIPSHPQSDLAPTIAYGILAAVFCAIAAVSFISVLLTNPTTPQIVLSALYLAALLGIQLGYFSRQHHHGHPTLTPALLLVQAAVVYVPILQFGSAWIGLPGLLIGSLLLSLRPRVSIPLSVLAVASIGWLGALHGRGALATTHLVISVIITGLVVYGLTRLTRLVRQLYAARSELARMAVVEERLRFAKDLHDLLGLSLSAITLKTELTHRLITDHPEQASEQLTEIMNISRQALADARSVASGYRELSLSQECHAAQSVLTTAGITVRLMLDNDTVPNHIDSVLATCVREGATNVLRHSKATWCTITVQPNASHVRLEIANDGVASEPNKNAAGSGLRNLTERVHPLGGTVITESDSAETFQLTVTIPLKH